MENLKKMTIDEAKKRIEAEFCSLMTKKDVLRLLDSLENCCDDEVIEEPTVALNKLVTGKKKEELITTEGSCKKFFVPYDINRSIHDVVNEQGTLNILGNLAHSPCKFLIYNSNDENNLVYPSKNNNGWRNTGNGNQDIRTFFSAPDESAAGGRRSKYQIIREEMRSKGIKEITVLVCPT